METVKTLNLRCQAIGETDVEGNIKVFFELNGQPRTVKVSNKHMVATIEKHPKADAANPNHVPAPMPRMIASVAVTQGKHVEAGDLLVTIEVMKMEIAICAEQSEIIAWVVAGAGTQVDAKDLILEFEGKQGVCKLVLQDKNRYVCGE